MYGNMYIEKNTDFETMYCNMNTEKNTDLETMYCNMDIEKRSYSKKTQCTSSWCTDIIDANKRNDNSKN